MIRFIIRRVVQGIITLWVIVSLVFVLFFLTKPNPARLLAGKEATVAQVATISKALGLNAPVWQQYLSFLNRLRQFNLCESYKLHEPVTTLIGQWVQVDISLAVGAGVIWLAMGLSVGILAARRPRSVWDRSATVFVLVGLSTPTFILGLLLLFVFFYILTTHGIAIFPSAGNYSRS